MIEPVDQSSIPEGIGLVAALTGVVWGVCLIVGAAGVLGERRPGSTPTTRPVDVASSPVQVRPRRPAAGGAVRRRRRAAGDGGAAGGRHAGPPAMPEAVALPSPAIAFAMPTKSPAVAAASAARPAPAVRATATAFRRFCLGSPRRFDGGPRGRRADAHPSDRARASSRRRNIPRRPLSPDSRGASSFGFWSTPPDA